MGQVKGTGNGMPGQNGPSSGGGKDTAENCAGVAPELSARHRMQLQEFDHSLSRKETPASLRTLLVRLRWMQLRGGYTQQEPAKRFAPPYRTPSVMPPRYHEIDDQDVLTVNRRRVNEDMTGGRRGTTVPPEQLVRFCAQVYSERTGAEEQTVLAELLRLRKESTQQARRVEQQRRDRACSSGLRGPDSKRVRELWEENDQLLSELAGLREHRVDQQRMIDKLSEEIADRGRHLEQMRADKTDLQARMAELSATLVMMTHTGQQQTNQISDLHKELASVRDDLAAKDQKINELTTERDQLHRQFARLRGETDRLQARLAELDTDAIDEAFQELAERSGLRSPLEHALIGGPDVRQDTNTDNPRGHIDRASQQLSAIPLEPSNDPAVSIETTTGTPQHIGASLLRQSTRVRRMLALFVIAMLNAVVLALITLVPPTMPSTTARSTPTVSPSTQPSVSPGTQPTQSELLLPNGTLVPVNDFVSGDSALPEVIRALIAEQRTASTPPLPQSVKAFADAVKTV